MLEKEVKNFTFIEESERRNIRRLKVLNEQAFAVAENKSQLLGTILDISREGVSFQFVGSIENWFADRDITNIRLVTTKDNLLLSSIPVSIVSNVMNNSQLTANSIQMRRVGARFGILSARQQFEIQEFIRAIT